MRADVQQTVDCPVGPSVAAWHRRPGRRSADVLMDMCSRHSAEGSPIPVRSVIVS